VSDRPSRRILLAADEARIAALYEAGWSIRALATEFGTSSAPISSALKRQGVTARASNNPRGRSPTSAKRRFGSKSSAPRRSSPESSSSENRTRNARASSDREVTR
jgi:hypothetical protein